jgi:asparagine synthase (glutamine-hydrolysing)
MCGIAGIVSDDREAAERVGTMLGAMRHRGVDGACVRSYPGDGRQVVLGATRLAIIDRTSAGLMPMEDRETGSALVFNGELYNYRELCAELGSRGVRVRTATDTEVMLRCLVRWGREALGRFRGMFALGFWSGLRRSLLIARDPAGKKPLYHAALPGGGLAFSSEVRALLVADLVPRRLDPDGLVAFLENGFPIAPTTLVGGVRALMPGTLLDVAGASGAVTPARYWQIPGPDGATRATPAELRSLLEAAVVRRLQSDAPLGILTSSGVDSTGIAGIARSSRGAPVTALTVGHFDAGTDESAGAAAHADAIGLAHHVHRVTPETLDASVQAVLESIDMPSIDGVQMFIAARAAAEMGLTVLVTGTGADELFGGYEYMHVARMIRPPLGHLAAMPVAALSPGTIVGAGTRRNALAGWRRRLVEADRTRGMSGVLLAHQVQQVVFSPSELAPLLDHDLAEPLGRWGLPAEALQALERESAGRPLWDALSVLAWRLFLGERQLRDNDQMGMASTVEIRAPFVDQDLVTRLLTVPPGPRMAGLSTKRYERMLLRPLLPGSVRIPLRKRGFSVPMGHWVATRPDLETWLGAPALRRVGLTRGLARERRSMSGWALGGAPLAVRQVWALLGLSNWAARFGLELH